MIPTYIEPPALLASCKYIILSYLSTTWNGDVVVGAVEAPIYRHDSFADLLGDIIVWPCKHSQIDKLIHNLK